MVSYKTFWSDESGIFSRKVFMRIVDSDVKIVKIESSNLVKLCRKKGTDKSFRTKSEFFQVSRSNLINVSFGL